MLVYIHGAKCVGIEAVPIVIEVEIGLGIGIHLVGLADAAVKESLLRTVTALQAKGFHIPGKKIVINLAPADMHKQGSGYDVPIALGIIAASDQRNLPGLEKYLIMGELGLDGSIRPVSGVLPMVELARRCGFKGCIFPEESALEAVDYDDTLLYGVRTLDDVLQILEEVEDVSHLLIWNTERYRQALSEASVRRERNYMDFADIIGQEGAKRGLEIASAGHHNAILIGAPGAGKSSLAKALAGILPPMSLEESAITSKIYSVAGKSAGGVGLMRTRPFRAPHISASKPALLGGGSGENILPGEVSLASNGVLFLDEFCEAPKSILESLRAPLEDRKVTISRLKAKIEYPASFMLIAASNPCPCGYYGEGDRCTCTVGQRASYLQKLSGPIMDRIDIQLLVHPVDTTALVRGRKAEPSEAIAARVLKAREIQRERFRGSGIFTNSEMNSSQLERFCPLSEPCKDLLEKLIDRLGLSARAYTRIIKIARTIADLSGEANIQPCHLSEAASYRFLDRRNILDL
ncbi:MAG: YifB family Mg chelatase-like AAA ATPase [Bacteroidales bacterium]|nr:YifB family Mg chelatase-like AAA ATPase [Bacteroidales bacterium]MBR5063531.1 YifB family Mg chelatase-like AAA ATPase [Bacteroidales bacterium]